MNEVVPGTRLRVLLVEDSPEDADLTRRALERGGYLPTLHRVEDEPGLAAALREDWDIVICDFVLPRMDVPRALAALRQSGREVPFIVVSGTAGEDVAVSTMRAGASDYLMKDRLQRLPQVVARVLAEALSRKRQHAAESALARSEEQLRLALEAAGMATWEWEVEADRLHWSAGAAEVLGLEPGAPPPQRLADLLAHVHPDDRLAAEGSLRRAAQGQPPVLQLEFRVLRAAESQPANGNGHGTPRVGWVEARGRASGGGAAGRALRLAGTLADTTHRRSLEEQLVHSQRMEAVGRLAGGVAHDFNNILTVLQSALDFLYGRMPAGVPLATELLGEMREAVQRAVALTQQLLVFARRDVSQPRLVDVPETVQGLARLLKRLVGENVEVKTELEGGSQGAWVDPTQLEQVLVNLAANARDAMPTGGTLTYRVWPLELPPPGDGGAPPPGLESVPDGHWVVVTVRDTGRGMDAETQRRIFEPFYTTKPSGRGTGLGLAICQAVVARAGGHLRVHSVEGQGTSFHVVLPLREAAQGARPGGAVGVDRVPRLGPATVLVVEDEAQVRRAAVRALELAGCQVLAARDGQEALSLASEHAGHIDAALVDIVMPRMGGVELVRRMQQSASVPAILFTSGYTADTVLENGLVDGRFPLLPKPYTPEQLVRSLGTLLSARRAGIPQLPAPQVDSGP